MFRFIKEHSGSMVFSILLHVAIVVALVGGFLKFRSASTPQPPPSIAIEATVVDEKQVRAEMQRQDAEKQQAEREAQEHAEQLKREQEAEAQKLEDLKRQRSEEEAAEKQRVEKRQADELERKRQADAKAEAQRKLKAEAERKQQEEQKRKAAEARQRAEQEAELKQKMAEEERRQSAVNSGLLAQYIGQIQARINRAWIRPPSAKAGLKCVVIVTQVPGGEVTAVNVLECNADEAVRRSVEAAVLRASPLPEPSDPTLFDRTLRITFEPDKYK